MRVVFLHNNFPAQFGKLGQYLVGQGVDVWFGTQKNVSGPSAMNIFQAKPHREITPNIHPYARNFETAVLNGQGIARACLQLKEQGIEPDVIMAHSGWGTGLFARNIWPEAKFIGYFEWYYNVDAPDVVFLKEGPRNVESDIVSQCRNAPILMDLAQSDIALCPTLFQRDQFPSPLKERMSVVHDGIETDIFKPNPSAREAVKSKYGIQGDKIITYVARGMEPYRGFPQFMEALETVLAREKDAHVLIVGDDRVAYGKKLPEGDSFKKRALKERNLDWSRVHFTGLLPYTEYLATLQASSVHAYLTIPFVLSWSMMEAMSAQCAIVASDVDPVREIAAHDERALRLTPFDPPEIAENILAVLKNEALRHEMGVRARDVIIKNYAAHKCYAAKEEMMRSLIA